MPQNPIWPPLEITKIVIKIMFLGGINSYNLKSKTYKK